MAWHLYRAIGTWDYHISALAVWNKYTEVRSTHIYLPVRGVPWRVLLQHSIMLRCIFIVECSITCCLCAMCVLKVQTSSSSPRLLCAKFRFFHSLHCWASPWRKIGYSVNHSITHSPSPSLFDAPGTEALVLENKLSSHFWTEDIGCEQFTRQLKSYLFTRDYALEVPWWTFV